MSNKTIERLKEYRNKWAALSEPDEEIVVAGRDVIEAQADAESRGYKGEITFLKVHPFGQYLPRLL
jgi:hypothetical protein